MNKPNWKYAPEWANWLAQDENGNWFWFEEKPRPYTHSWFAKGQCLLIEQENPNWKETLEQRPDEHEWRSTIESQ